MRKRAINPGAPRRSSGDLSQVPLGRALEKDVKRRIIQFLRVHGIFCWVNVSTGIWDVTKSRFRALTGTGQLKGTSDILGIFNGKLLAIEVKAPGKKNTLTIHQRDFIDAVNRHGGIAFVSDSVEDTAKQLGLGEY